MLARFIGNTYFFHIMNKAISHRYLFSQNKRSYQADSKITIDGRTSANEVSKVISHWTFMGALC